MKITRDLRKNYQFLHIFPNGTKYDVNSTDELSISQMGWSRPLPFLVQNGIHCGILPDRMTVFVGAEVKIFDKLSLFPHPESLHQTLGRFVFGIAHGNDAMGKSCAERCIDDSGGCLGRISFFPVCTIEYPADFPGGKRTGREKDVSDQFAPWVIVIGRQTNGDEIGIGDARAV